ncbi:MAG: hypothetical protein JWR80_8917 [Bradyrhizobium sp.]|nr:hypothetical protein [Bradyrhizobium sp.]
MTLTQAEWTDFRALIDEPVAHKELECQGYLMSAAGLLLPGSPSQIVGVEEERNFFGRTDFIVAADLLDGTNQTSRQAYIFELKAPQCNLFETVTGNRCQPTREFHSAENQLLHYYDEAAGNSRFRQRMGIIDQDNIHMGGIIIGTRGRLLRGGGNTAAATTALRVREKYLYQSFQIKVLTWDRILDYVRPV